jgi:hypothetical protein
LCVHLDQIRPHSLILLAETAGQEFAFFFQDRIGGGCDQVGVHLLEVSDGVEMK